MGKRKLRIRFRTLLEIATLAAWCFIAISLARALAYNLPDFMVLPIGIAIALGGLGIYHLLKEYVEIVHD